MIFQLISYVLLMDLVPYVWLGVERQFLDKLHCHLLWEMAWKMGRICVMLARYVRAGYPC